MDFRVQDGWTLEKLADTGRKYAGVVVDPPWHFETWSERGTGRSASQHYDTQGNQWLLDLAPAVKKLATRNSVLYLWVVQTHIPFAVSELMPAWGFEFKTVAFTWVKLSRNCPPGEWREHIGMGMYTRANPESIYEAHYATEGEVSECMLGRRGEPDRWSRGERQLIIAPIREHSRKPDEMYQRIQRLSPGPFIELFARENPARPPSWDAWGTLETPSQKPRKNS